MGGERRTLPFDQAVEVNPPVPLEPGEVYPFVDMQAVEPSSRDVKPKEYREFRGGGSRFRHGDTLMARITPCLENGKIARFWGPSDQLVAHGSTEFIVIRGRDGVTDDTFAYYLTRSEVVRSYAVAQMRGTSGRQRVPVDALHHLQVCIPPLSEQRAIAHILGTLDDKIELNRRMSETLEAMARAIFKAWFVDFEPVRAKMEGRWRRGESLPGLPAHLYDLFPDRLVDSELGKIPEGWEVFPLGDVLELAYGKALKEENRKPGIVPVYGSNGQVGWNDEALARGPGIIVGRKGNPGTVTWVHTDFFAIDTTFYVVPKNKCPSLYFLFYALSAHDLPSLAADSAVPGLNRNFVYSNLQLVPPPHVLDAFDRTVKPFFDKQYQNDLESRTLAALRDALLPKLISGEIRVKDMEKFLERAGV